MSRCFYHSRTSSLIADRSLLDSATVGGLLSLLPEDERYGLKYVTVCLEEGVAGDVDRDSLVAALEVFGQIRDSGVNPKDVFQKLTEREVKVAPLVKARQIATPAVEPRQPVPSRRKPVKSRPVIAARRKTIKRPVLPSRPKKAARKTRLR